MMDSGCECPRCTRVTEHEYTAGGKRLLTDWEGKEYKGYRASDSGLAAAARREAELLTRESMLMSTFLARLDRDHPSWQASGSWAQARKAYITSTSRDEAELSKALDRVRTNVTAEFPVLAAPPRKRVPAANLAGIALVLLGCALTAMLAVTVSVLIF